MLFHNNYKNIINQFQNQNKFNLNHNIKNWIFTKNLVTSGASRSTFKLSTLLPIQIKVKKFNFSKKKKSGRSNKYGILCRSKGFYSFKNKYPYFCKSYRLLSLSFIANIFLVPFKFNLFSLIFSSTGSITYTKTGGNHNLFNVFRLQSILTKNNHFYKKFLYISKFIKIPQLFFLIYQLPKYKLVSLLEVFPKKGIKYVRSSASKAFLTKIDLKLNLSLVKLPSGVHKVFSNFSVGSINSQPFSSKKLLTPMNAGFYKKLGRKSLSRGIAKNPTDHPHGGRSKAIKYQRTPWGKTTKYK